MAVTTYTQFVSNLATMAVTGIGSDSRLASPPTQINPGDLPISYPQYPRGSVAFADGPMTADGEGGWPTHRCELVIVAVPTRQDNQPANFLLLQTLTDAASTALRTTTLAQSKNIWTIIPDLRFIGDKEYWTLLITVEASG